MRRKRVKSAGKVDDSRVTRNRFFSVCMQKRVCFGKNRVGLIFLYCHGKWKMFNFVQKNPGFRIIFYNYNKLIQRAKTDRQKELKQLSRHFQIHNCITCGHVTAFII